MSTMFQVSQSFEIPCDRHKFIHCKKDTSKFWEEADEYAMKQGCYVFAIRAGRGYTPWYVGKTKKTFKDECFTDNKINKYHEALHLEGKTRKGKPVIFFVAPPGGKNIVPKETVKQLETFLIQAAYYANPELINKAKAKPPDWSIKGVVRAKPGPMPKQARVFAKMMDLRPHTSGAVRKHHQK